MTITRFCTRLESIPFDAINVVTLWGPLGSLNDNTDLPYLYRFNLSKESNDIYSEYKVEKKIKNSLKYVYNMVLGERRESIDFRKLFPHRSLEELAKEFNDEWDNVNLDSYVKNFHDSSYEYYCDEINRYSLTLKTDFEIKKEEIEEEERKIKENNIRRRANILEFEDDMSDDNNDDF